MSNGPRGVLFFCTIIQANEIDNYIEQALGSYISYKTPVVEHHYNRYSIDIHHKYAPFINDTDQTDNVRLDSCEIFTNKDALGALVTSYKIWDKSNKDIVELSRVLCNKAWSWNRARGDNADPSQERDEERNKKNQRDKAFCTTMAEFISYIINNPYNPLDEQQKKDWKLEIITPSEDDDFKCEEYKPGQESSFFDLTSDPCGLGSSFIFSYFSAEDDKFIDDEDMRKEAEDNFKAVLNNVEASVSGVHFKRYLPNEKCRANFSNSFYAISLPTGQAIVHRYKRFVPKELDDYVVHFIDALLCKVKIKLDSNEFEKFLNGDENNSKYKFKKVSELYLENKNLKDYLDRSVGRSTGGHSIAIQWLKRTRFPMLLNQAIKQCEQIIDKKEGDKRDKKDAVLAMLSGAAIFSILKDGVDLIHLGDNLYIVIPLFFVGIGISLFLLNFFGICKFRKLKKIFRRSKSKKEK